MLHTGKGVHPVFHDPYNEMEIRSGTGSWLWNIATGGFVFSPNFCRLTGVAAPEVLSDVYHAVHPEDRGLLTGTVDIMRVHRYIPEYEFRMINGSHVRYIRQFGKLYTGENNQEYLCGFWQDITKQKNRKQVVLFYENLIDASIDGIIVLDKHLRVTLWNNHTEKTTQLGRTDVTGRNILDVLPGMRNCIPVMEALSRAQNGFTSFVPADKNFCDNGTVESHYIPILDAIGNAAGILCIQHDIKHRIKTEKELKELNETNSARNRELKRRNAELQALAYGTGADLKEPLRRMYTAIEMITGNQAMRIPEKEKIQLRQLQAAVQRVGLLADDMISFSRLDADKIEFEDIDMNTVLSAALKKIETELVEANAVVKTEPLPLYHGHRSMLVLLFRNILSNAVKFRREDTLPEIIIDAEKINGSTIRHNDADPAAVYLLIRVADNGIGFDSKYNERIFNANMRINRGKYSGVGIGLALAMKIAQMHSGFITAESVPGSGSVFSCFLKVGLEL